MPTQQLIDVRAELVRQGLDGLIVPRADEHLGEYVPAGAERLAWLTGFTGSAGLAIVLANGAAAFTDGRYVLQMAAQISDDWQRCHITEDPPERWLAGHAGAGARIGYDPWLLSEESLARYNAAGVTLVPVERNPIDAVWADRPLPPLAPAVPHPLAYAGHDAASKRDAVAASLKEAGHRAAVLVDPASVAWLLNIRGGDVPFTPFALGFALVHDTGAVELFMAAEKLPPDTLAWLGNAVSVQDRAALPAALGRLAGQTVRVDLPRTPAWFAQTLRAAGAVVADVADPCTLPKACKNEVERSGARAAHVRDAVAVCRFLHWLGAAAGQQTEMSAARQLLALRSADALFRGESFPAISGSGPNGAIIHYRVTPATDRMLGYDETYLIDSGAQYLDGTTDVTRTVWTGPGVPHAALRDAFTRVLKGHIALALVQFPKGVAGPHLDALARAALWQAGLDYDHGTGHGVGSYLSVHEGPASISRAARPVPLAEGMILSNEPGYYLPGAYGIRLENLLLVEPRAPARATRAFLGFETLTLAPFDRRLIDVALLNAVEREWLDAYHARVLGEVGPLLPSATLAWLAGACAPL